MAWQIVTLVASRRSRRLLLPVGSVLAVLVFLGVLMIVGAVASSSPKAAVSGAQGTDCPATGVALSQLQLDADQSANARTIVQLGQKAGVPTKGQVIAIAAALTESELRNKKTGDLDSVGLFQMRPSQGWGTQAQLLDTTYATNKFYAALTAIQNWQSLSVNDAAQAVERSGFPNAYGPHEQQAVQIVAAVATTTMATGTDTSGCTPVESMPQGPAGTMLQTAINQIGKPYVWGATGPNSFDCSGLIVFAWRAAGYQLHVRTSEEMYSVAVPVPQGQELPGDLIFSQWGEDGLPGPGHVQIVVSRGTLVEAPRTGLNVRETPYSYSSKISFGRLPASSMSSTAAG